jgi:predicted amidohydrolase
VDAAIQIVYDFAGQPQAAGVDLLLFPECFLQGYLVTEQHVRSQAIEVGTSACDQVLARLASIQQLLVLGMIERAGRSCYNTALVVSGGRLLGRYRKTYLVSADVTGQRDATRIGLGPTRVINPAGQVVAHVPAGTTGIAAAETTIRSTARFAA